MTFQPMHEFNPKPNEKEGLLFTDKLENLLPGVEFEEPVEMSEARLAILEALTRSDQNPDLLRHTWAEYSKVCEQVVDDKSDIQPQNRAHLQIAILVHKALIFREVGDMQRYGEDLSDAEEYAYNMYFDEIAEMIGAELDKLAE